MVLVYQTTYMYLPLPTYELHDPIISADLFWRSHDKVVIVFPKLAYKRANSRSRKQHPDDVGLLTPSYPV